MTMILFPQPRILETHDGVLALKADLSGGLVSFFSALKQVSLCIILRGSLNIFISSFV